jgi:predicted N-acetyltransferase YhbS
MHILRERPEHAAAIESLLAGAFGPDRFGKTVYRLRAGLPPLASLGLVACAGGEAGYGRANGAVIGTLRFWPVVIDGDLPSLLLGPLAVAAEARSVGLGASLMREGLDRAAAQGHASVLLVGDEPYYRRFGFRRDLARGLTLPGPVDAARFLALELAPGALSGVTGRVGRAPVGVPMRVAA